MFADEAIPMSRSISTRKDGSTRAAIEEREDARVITELAEINDA